MLFNSGLNYWFLYCKVAFVRDDLVSNVSFFNCLLQYVFSCVFITSSYFVVNTDTTKTRSPFNNKEHLLYSYSLITLFRQALSSYLKAGGILAHNTKIFIKSLLFTIKSWNLIQFIFELYFLFCEKWRSQQCLIMSPMSIHQNIVLSSWAQSQIFYLVSYVFVYKCTS